ncbi:FecR family protein [Ruegeria denitrificans]|uniref:FecR family protein n=1 Tax=Ruegeria denitrificans TaxID=1715692 RepID=UPI001FB53DAD|nr:FecR domain-containing protein [Ruegeria denitrificans]
MAWLKELLVVCCVLLLPSQILANIGKVIGVEQGAKVTRAGKSQPLRTGMDVASGDSISTDGSGLVQLIFVDDTKIAIGPNARMTLDVTMLRGNKKAKNFAVQALGGSFRFISGKSKKRAYSIQTPTATMAVRGTTFDLWVAPGSQSAMMMLQGRVSICALGGSCQETGSRCNLLATTQNGGIGRPVDQESYDQAVKEGFPFVHSQEQLLLPLQTNVTGCGTDTLPPVPQRAEDRTPSPDRAPQSGVQSSAAGPSQSSSPPENNTDSIGSGNGGSVGGSTGSGNGNGGGVSAGNGSGNGNGGNIGGSSGSSDAGGGSIGGGSGSGEPGSGGTIGGEGSGGFGGSAGSGATDGNGGNSGG